MHGEINGFDRTLLNALQHDGSRTNAKLAEIVGLSASQISRRRTRLKANGVISGYHAHLDAKASGLNVKAFVRVNLRSHSKASAGEFSTLVESNRLIVEAISVSGDANYILTVECETLEAFASFIHETLLPHENISQVRSELVLRDLKRRFPAKQVIK